MRMDCRIDHTKLAGLRFCTGCGVPLHTSQQSQTNSSIAARVAQPLENSQVEYLTQAKESFMPRNNSTRNSLLAVAGGLVLIVLFGIFLKIASKPIPVSVSASLTLVDQKCYDLSWGYFDIPGAQITLTVDGVVEGYATFPRFGSTSILGCKFSATFSDIPADGETYSYSLASGRRGVITRTLSEMQANDWSFDLTLG